MRTIFELNVKQKLHMKMAIENAEFLPTIVMEHSHQYNPSAYVVQLQVSNNECIMKQFRSTLFVWQPPILALLSLILVASRVAADDLGQLRVLSYNIHHAEGVDQKLDLERIAKVIHSVKPDIVVLQEVDQKVTRSGSIDQPAELARLTKMNFAFGANIPLQGGHYGNAVLSRFPVVSHKNHLLPNFDNGEQRGVLATEIDIPRLDEPLLLLATHLDHRRDGGERMASAKAINKLLALETSRPALLAGDLNDVPGSVTLKEFDSAWTRVNNQPLATIPVASPERQIDFILFRPREHWKVVEVKVLDESIASDHRAIFAALEFLPQQASKNKEEN